LEQIKRLESRQLNADNSAKYVNIGKKMDVASVMSRDAIVLLEQLGRAECIGFGVDFHVEGEDPRNDEHSRIDLAFRTTDLNHCFCPEARVLFDSEGENDISGLQAGETVFVIEEFARSLRMYVERIDDRITVVNKLLEHDVYFDVIEGPLRGIVRRRLPRLRQVSDRAFTAVSERVSDRIGIWRFESSFACGSLRNGT
jgi:hypothetical protein